MVFWLATGAVVASIAAMTSYFYPNIGRDIKVILSLLKLAKVAKQQASQTNPPYSVLVYWNERLQATPNRTALIFEDKRYSFQQLEELSNKMANWLVTRNIKKGDVVSILMENRPEFIIFILSCAKIGAAASLINSHLKGTPLAHALNTSNAKLLLFGTETAAALHTVLHQISGLPLFAQGEGSNEIPWATPMDSLWESASTTPPFTIGELQSKYQDDFLHIFTSGTTGLPKAAKVKHLRFIMAGVAFTELFPMNGEFDVMYCALPLYHSSAGIVGISCMICKGVPFVIRRKFSASQFWNDCRRYNVTIIQYIGELLRFLVSTPPSSLDRQHSVRLALGNGLRPEVWTKFKERFGVTMIGEFYASTEGNCQLINYTGKQNAVGFISPMIQQVYPVKLVRYDLDNDVVIRNSAGKCINCKPGEIGELIGLIDQSDPGRQFDGYVRNSDATEKKIIRNVFKTGDMYFRSGDLMVMDSEGYIYFKDRIGDTFRWKGENVATTEVSEVIGMFPEVQEANVYGVAIPGFEGRAGMAALSFHTSNPDWAGLYAHLTSQLASYAVPLFIRVISSTNYLETHTSTFKQLKTDLVRDGFNPAIGEPIYFADVSRKTYVPLNSVLYERIIAGEVRM